MLREAKGLSAEGGSGGGAARGVAGADAAVSFFEGVRTRELRRGDATEGEGDEGAVLAFSLLVLATFFAGVRADAESEFLAAYVLRGRWNKEAPCRASSLSTSAASARVTRLLVYVDDHTNFLNFLFLFFF